MLKINFVKFVIETRLVLYNFVLKNNKNFVRNYFFQKNLSVFKWCSTSSKPGRTKFGHFWVYNTVTFLKRKIAFGVTYRKMAIKVTLFWEHENCDLWQPCCLNLIRFRKCEKRRKKWRKKNKKNQTFSALNLLFDP